jgi:uncharacterized phage-associated protein
MTTTTRTYASTIEALHRRVAPAVRVCYENNTGTRVCDVTYDGRAIANFVLDHAERAGVTVTNLSLQKIVYFCHVWSLISLQRPLVKHSFEAWEYGPVLQYVYREFKGFGASAITGRARRLEPLAGRPEIVPYAFDQETLEMLKQVVNFYVRLSASMLVELTHAEGGPWHKVWNHAGKVNPGMRIDNRDIAGFYARVSTPFTLQ